MITELITLLNQAEKKHGPILNTGKLKVSKKQHIRSISAFSSGSIFYFPVLVGDQILPEEVTMVNRMIERSYASFVASCISMIPVHRISADDADAIGSYLQRFHQNLDIKTSSAGLQLTYEGLPISAEIYGENAASEFILECWNRSKELDQDFVSLVSESVSLGDMFNESPIDAKTDAMRKRFRKVNKELETWGFIGEAATNPFTSDNPEVEDEKDILNEDKLRAKQRNRLHDKTFGLPEERKYPLNDEGHVRQAIRMFGHCEEGKRKELARNIKKAMNKFGISNDSVGNENPLKEYLNESSDLYMQSASHVDYLTNYINVVNDYSIANTFSFTKLSAMENWLNGIRDKLTKILNRYKSKVKYASEDKRVGLKFNNYLYMDPSAFVQKYNETVALIDRKLQKIEEQRALVRKQGIQDSPNGFGELQVDAMQQCNEMLETTLNSADAAIFTYEDYLEEEEDLEDAYELDDEYLDDHIEDAYQLEEASNQKNIPETTGVGFGRQMFLDADAKRANDATPTYIKADISFVVNETNETIKRELLVGIKAYVHKVKSVELVNELYNSVINKRKFLKFVKFITGEEKSLADLMFGFREMKSDALSGRGLGKWRNAFKRRKRLSKVALPYLMKEYTPNGTVVITMQEVEFIKREYGINIMDPMHIKTIMEDEFLLGFVVVDQTEELVYVCYDGHEYGFQTYTYAMLERENNNFSKREMMQMYRSLSR